MTRRGLFGLFAGAGALPYVKVPKATAQSFPKEGVELAALKWYNSVRGFGFFYGLESGHDLLVRKELWDPLSIGNDKFSLRYTVAWRMGGRGPVVHEIRHVRKWTPEEREQVMQSWRRGLEEGFA